MIINGGIVTYNPDIEKLKKNISRIAGQVCKLVIADNGSKNIEDIKRLAAAFENVSVILNYENFGIARALNQIMKWSSNNGGDWTITLDQDSFFNKLADVIQKSISSQSLLYTTFSSFRLRSVYLQVSIPTSSLLRYGLYKSIIQSLHSE